MIRRDSENETIPGYEQLSWMRRIIRETCHRNRNRFLCQAPMVGWAGGHCVRVSIQCYNSPHDVDRLVEALERLL